MPLAFGCKSYDKPRHCIIKKTHHLTKLSVNKKNVNYGNSADYRLSLSNLYGF